MPEEFKLQGHTTFQGLSIAIENRKGSVRKGVGKDGVEWRTKMKFPYGYIKGSEGKDGEEVDCYVGPNKDAPFAYVVHQHKEDGTGHDEDKIMLAFNSEEEARKAYLAHYDDPKFLGPISKVPMEKLKAMIASGKPTPKIASAFASELLKIAESNLDALKRTRIAARKDVPPDDQESSAPNFGINNTSANFTSSPTMPTMNQR